MLRMVVLSLLAFSVTACRPVWTAQTIPACYAPSGAPELDRERSYLAALLALEARGYAILHAEAPVQLEAEYKSSYKPEKAHAHWLIDVLPDASLHVDSVPAGVPVPSKAQAWVQKLQQNIQSLQCRDLNWLRWEAQNRGLMPMILPTVEAQDDASAATGGERAPDLSAAPLAAGANGPPTVPPSADSPRTLSAAETARHGQLEREREELRLTLPMALVGSGLGSAVLAFGLGVPGFVYFTEDCGSTSTLPADTLGSSSRDCSKHALGRNLLIAAGAAGIVSAVFLAMGVPRLVGTLRRRRQVDRELRALDQPQLSFDVTQRGANLSLRATF